MFVASQEGTNQFLIENAVGYQQVCKVGLSNIMQDSNSGEGRLGLAIAERSHTVFLSGLQKS